MSKEVAVTYTVDDELIKLTPTIVSEYLAGGANITMPEFKFFTSLCKARGLNPFLKEAYIIKYGNNPAQIVVGKDAILKRAILNPDFDGREQGIIIIDKDGNTTNRQGSFIATDETLVGGWAKAYRKSWRYPVIVTVGFAEVAQRKRDGTLNLQWSTKGATMVEKVAVVRALREAFVESTGGMYDVDEVQSHEKDDDVIESVVIQEEPRDENEALEEDSGVIDINDV